MILRQPVDLFRTNRGWFSLGELQAWAVGKPTPVVREPQLDHMATWPQYENWESRLTQGLARIGAVARHGMQLTWLDRPGGIPAFRYRATRETEAILPSGNYAFHPVVAQHAMPLSADMRRAPYALGTLTGTR